MMVDFKLYCCKPYYEPMKAAILLRLSLIPYIYTAAHAAYNEGKYVIVILFGLKVELCISLDCKANW